MIRGRLVLSLIEKENLKRRLLKRLTAYTSLLLLSCISTSAVDNDDYDHVQMLYKVATAHKEVFDEHESKISNLDKQLKILSQKLTQLSKEVEELKVSQEALRYDIKDLKDKRKELIQQIQSLESILKQSVAMAVNNQYQDTKVEDKEVKDPYEIAQELILKKEYEAAKSQLVIFIQESDDQEKLSRASFQICQIHQIQSDKYKAIDCLYRFIEKYPSADLTPKASLQLALMLQADGNIEEAKEIYNDIINKYSGSKIAEEAYSYLQLIQ